MAWKFSFYYSGCLTEAQEPSLFYLPIAGMGRRDEFILFLLPRVLKQNKLQTGARGAMVIAVGNEHGDWSSNPGR